jgi:hypothetical protein
MNTNDYVTFILIRVLNDEGMMNEYLVLCQPYLHFLHGFKYNTLTHNDIVMINESTLSSNLRPLGTILYT